MSEIILHHYAMSPYSEKIRAILGYKKLAWKSVTQPVVLPKPDLLPLTGGYRKTPVMQIGRDIYCDTSLIARVLDRLHPAPELAPARHKASCAAFAAIEQTLFLASVPVVFQPAGLKVLQQQLGQEVMDRFAKDRAALFEDGAVRRPNSAFSKLHFLPLMNAIDKQLGGGDFLLGDAPTLADFIAYHPVWFVLGNPGVVGTLDAFKNILAWAERIKAFGHGASETLSPGAAIEVARNAKGAQEFDGPLLEPDGVKLGQRVAVRATDYGCDPIEGTLAHASVFELVVKRQDERAGEVLVHFPRNGFSVAAVSQ
jgi:glutathione S-transferase